LSRINVTNITTIYVITVTVS